MTTGPGKYDDICTLARVATKGLVALLIVIDGERGSGFSMQGFGPLVNVPAILRETADQIDADLGPVTPPQ